MRNSDNYIIKVIATGLVTLILVTIVISWPRKLCDNGLALVSLHHGKGLVMRPSGLVPELDNDSEVVSQSVLRVRRREELVLYSWAIGDDIKAAQIEGSKYPKQYVAKSLKWISVDTPDSSPNAFYFDEKLGLFVLCQLIEQCTVEKHRWAKKIHAYLGPEGASDTPDEKIGQFGDLIYSYELRDAVIVFDKDQSRFFRIDFKQKKVTKGPELGTDSDHKPIDVGRLVKNRYATRTDWEAPGVKVYVDSLELEGYLRGLTYRPGTTKPTATRPAKRPIGVPIKKGLRAGRPPETFILVLDESGRIDKLDSRSLEFIGVAGYLPTPRGYLSDRSYLPKNLFSYDVLAVTDEGEYRGLIVAGMNQDCTGISAAVYGETGGIVLGDSGIFLGREIKRIRKAHESSEIHEAPGGVALLIGKYLLENIHPPILSIASYLTASNFEATSASRALFLLPNSYVGMFGYSRDAGDGKIGRFLAALFIISPSIVLGIFLAWRVKKDAILVGLSRDARRSWIIGTIAFGIAAYITYRLTRPKITLVTCANCGKMRRPDMELCHRCGSQWHLPKLIPPTWRVIDLPAEQQELQVQSDS